MSNVTLSLQHGRTRVGLKQIIKQM